MVNINIIKAKEDMCKELSLLKRQVWETTYRGIYPDEKLDNYDYIKQEESFKSYINSKTLTLYVVMHDNKIIGYTAIGNSPHRPDSSQMEIVMLYILKEYQGLGIGKKVFNFAKELIKSKGKQSFLVYCNKYNLPAQAFYKKMGGTILKIDEDNPNRNLPQITFIFS